MSRATRRKKHPSPPPGYVEGDVKNGRVWILHPRKGWRCLSVRRSVDERKLHPFIRYMRGLYRRMGKLV